MSSVRETLAAQLVHFDDEAFAALANRGLLRRAQKDLQSQLPTVAEEANDSLTLAVGAQRVRFDARGAAHGQCSCPASGVCQHILAAAIWLQRQANIAAPAATAKAEGDADPIAVLRTALLHMDAASLTKHAGKAGYRWAWQFVQDLEPEQGLRISGEKHILLSFSHPRVALRFMGGAVDSLVADVDISQVEKYRVAAVLAYQRSNGLDIVPPEPAGKPRTASLDLGKDHGGDVSNADAQIDSRARLRESAKQLFCECVELGLSHLSQAIYERYSTLAVWAQGAEYYRLALLLRRIADHIEMLLQRSGGADEHRLFDELTIAYGLVSALDHATVNGTAPAHLVGRARSQYEKSGKLELLGLGAIPWRSASGYVGLTMVLWSPADQAFYSCSDARPENQRGFNPVARYKAAGPWGGLGAPEQVTGRQVVLTGAQINAAARLSAAESTAAAVKPVGTTEVFSAKLNPCASWKALAHARVLARRSLLAEPQPMKDWAVLHPARFGDARFDSTRQVTIWPLFDADDEQLNIELPYNELTEHAITRIEQLTARDLVTGTLVVARIRQGETGLVADPLSLVRASSAAGVNPVDALYFDVAPKQGIASQWLSKFRRLTGQDEKPLTPLQLASPLPAALRELRNRLQKQAERGVPRDHVDQFRLELNGWAQRCAAAGLDSFLRLLPENLNTAALLLRHHYLCLQYERLIAGFADDVN